ncbi:hypothetical protein [Nonomuraea sp. SBT364]|uniref:hypothetical protein n=1 Tax=Nonomuraea sp. SBT364 TaxID=1580530 RepID=UPI0012E12CE7|nr:hypothetical protein [Nonomuraea sp. SBT364]
MAMLPGHHVINRQGRPTAGALIVLGGQALVVKRVVSGEGLLPHETIEVAPEALREVSGIGTIMAQTIVDPIYENTVQVCNILIMDMGASSFEEAAIKARTRLEERGWVLSGKPNYSSISMESPKWEFTRLSIKRVHSITNHGADVGKAVTSNAPRSASYVLIDVTPYR